MPGDEYGKELTERPRATAQQALQPRTYRDQPLSQSDVDFVAAQSTQKGTVAGAAAAFAASGLVYLANSMSPRFRGALGVSGKLALVVTPTAGAFFLRSHLTIADARADPEGFMLNNGATRGTSSGAGKSIVTAAVVEQKQLTIGQTISNVLYNHSFKVIGGIALPLYGAVFYRESTHPSTASMLLSQRLIHTRVYGQMIAVLSTVSVMAFAKGMEAEGGAYRIVNGKLVRGEQSNLRHWYSEIDGQSPKRGAKGGERHRAAKDDDEGKAMLRAMEARRVEEERRLAEQELNEGMSINHLLVPLLYAPVLPLVRIGLRNRVPPERLTHISLGIIGVALSHAGYIMFSDSTIGFREA